MLKTPLPIILLTICLTTLFFSACKKKEETPDAGTGGGGGASVTAANYAGTWTVNDNCSPGSFQITITASGSTNVSITNFRKGFNLSGTVSGNTLTIPQQNSISGTLGGPYQFSGSGTLNGNSLSISYIMADGGGNYPQNCSDSCTK